MEIDPSSLDRIKAFAEFLQRAKEAGTKLSFVSTPTEHGDNITATATIDGERKTIGILFWDVSLLQERGMVDTLDEDDLALGMNISDGMVEDAEKILSFAKTESAKIGNS
jgi:hypothetical protein